TGRETFLLPVTWQDGWPVILEAGKVIPYVAPAPAFLHKNSDVPPTTGNFTWRDDFDSAELDPAWLTARVPSEPWLDLRRRKGSLSLTPLPLSLATLDNPAFLARRQQHIRFEASTSLEVPEPGIAAGMAAFQSEAYWYFFGARSVDDGLQLFLEKSTGGKVETVAAATVEAGRSLRFRIGGDGRRYSFWYGAGGSGWKPFRLGDDGSILSTEVAGGFVGAVVGVHARVEQGGRRGAQHASPATRSEVSQQPSGLSAGEHRVTTGE
ncbi:MAG TPA: hypothetical protein VFZ51_11060, partial [Woeseiaceae bacterium]